MEIELNHEQEAVINSTAKNKLVIAGPGSGKTRTMVEAIKEAIKNGADPQKIAVITFTNAGAKEFMDRLDCKLGYAGTRHGLMFRLIQEHGNAFGYRNHSVTILLPSEYEALVQRVKDRLGYKISLKSIKSNNDKREVQAILREVAFQMQLNNCVNYDQILEIGYNIAQKTNLGFTHLFCDEVQDNSKLDWMIDEAIDAEFKMFVGDPDQSIYKFRGASPEEMLKRINDSRYEVFYLIGNYRSTPSICHAANKLIRHNENRPDKQIVSLVQDAHDGEPMVFFKEFEIREDEHSALDASLRTMTIQSCAVLARTNREADLAREYLESHGIKVAEKKPDLPADWSTMMEVMTLVQNPGNDIVAESLCSKLMSKEQLAHAKEAASINGLPLSKNAQVKFDWGSVGLMGATAFAVSPESMALSEERRKLLFGDEDIELGMSSDKLATWLLDLSKPELWDQQDQDGVVVTTIHQSKGREWDWVYVIGFDDDHFPMRNADIEEERRLTYVALTRARSGIVFSRHLWKFNQAQSGMVSKAKPSPFWNEMT